MIETPRLRLRRLTAEDVEDYAALIGDPEVMRFIGAGVPATRHDAVNAIEEFNARYDSDGFGQLAVERITDGRVIGRVGFWVWNRRDWTGGWTQSELGADAEVELGWALIRSAWGFGYATEAARAMREHGYTRLGLVRLI
jgi:RimJ/RimL family protein N-acetyltransferase